jgi:predicted MFS family arabinose efflux permease
MSGEPFYAGNNIIGMLGLCGIAGAMTASLVGKYVRILGVRKLNYIGCSIMILSWIILYVFQNSYIGIIAGIILIDIGMQCVQLSNQTCALSLAPHASNEYNFHDHLLFRWIVGNIPCRNFLAQF